MKKIYSIVLMAAALLIGTNVKAETLTAGTAAALVSAFENAQSGDEIKLTDNIEIPSSITTTASSAKVSGVTCYNPNYYNIPYITIDGKDLTLNLNEHWIKDEDNKYRSVIFYLKKGHLSIKGNGSITCNNNEQGVSANKPSKGYPVWVSGNADSTAVEGEWTSKLTVGAGVTLTGNAAGVYIDGYAGTVGGNHVNGLSDLKSRADVGTMKGVTYPYGNLGNTANANKCAFNVWIEIEKGATVVGRKYGAQVSGNLQYVPNKDHREFLPTIHIANGATARALKGDETYSVGAYVGGFGHLVVEGDVHGATGIYAKSGEIEVKGGATVHSDASTYTASGDKRSGVESAGSGILMDSNAAYAGNMTITVSGDAKISGNGGYAVESTVTYAIPDPEDPTDKGNEVQGIILEGGNFTSGTKGCLEVAPVIADAANVNIKIDNVDFNAAADDEQINALLAATGDKYIVTAVVDENGDDQLVIVPISDPSKSVVHNPNLNDLADGQTYIELAGGSQTLTKDIVLDNLTLVKNLADEGAEVIISDGVTLKVGSITIDDASSIIVKAGATLVITGDGGIAAYSTDNIVIEAKEGKMGRFWMSPDTKSRKNPAATVQMISKGYTKADGTPVFQRFGVPAAEGMLRGDIKYDNATSWNYWNDGWKNCPKTMKIMPFVGLDITSLATAPGEVYTMASNILGNADGNLAFTSQWNCFANSYTGDVDLKQLLTNLKADGEVNAAIWVYRAEDDWWDGVSLIDFDEDVAAQTALNPMQAFLFHLGNGSDYNFTLNYADNVWYPKFPKAGAPARKQAVNNITKAIINITSESGHTDRVTVRQDASFSNELDNGAELVKYMNENSFNIYAATEIGDMAQLATDDLNGQILTIATKDETKFKMTFSNTNGEQLAIRDNLTGSVINMVEGAEYFFSVAENSVSERFEIVAIHNAPTAVENVSAANNGAVYTIFGQYVGEKSDWNILPAGIYVIDGVKVVK